MKKMVVFKSALFAWGVFSLSGGALAAVPEAAPARFYPYESGYPDRRPAKAPVAVFERNTGWYVKALTGISRPYPYSLTFLDSQGTWYTPFNRPGMPGYYDIRGMHRSVSATR